MEPLYRTARTQASILVRHDGLDKLLHVVVRVGLPKRGADVAEEVLPVNEGNSALDGRFGWHDRSKKITRLTPFGGSAG